jgi:hypothetical protein
MKKQIITAISMHPIRAAFLLILPFLLGLATHEALAQRNTGKPSTAVDPSGVAPSSTGAISAVAQGNQLPPTSIQGAVGSKPNAPMPTETPAGVTLPAPSEPTGPWMLGNPYPTTIVRYGFAQTATDFYIFGGVSDGNRVNNVNRMDIASGVWQSRAPMPFTSEAPTCALMASTGIVYCAEGDTGNGFAAYNIATDTWTPLASDPFVTNHYGSASGAFNGKVFVAGGTSAFSSAVDVYDVATNTWSAGTAAPNDFLLAGYQQVGQFLYVVGGFEVSGPNEVAAELSSVLSRGRQPKQPVPLANNTTTWRLDMSSAPGVWSIGPAFTGARADFGLAYDAGTNTLYAMGGDTTGGGFFDSTNEVDELSVASWPAGTWTMSPPNLILPNRQANQAGFNGAGQIWSVGGLVGQTFQFLSEVQRRTNGGGGGGCQYTLSQIGGSIVPGTTDTGNHGDDTVVTIALPFSYTLYDQTFTSINLSSNGNAQFTTTDTAFSNVCLPWSTHNYTIFPYWDDLYLVNSGFGIFTSVSGIAPNRIFNIEWRAQYFPGSGSANFELRLYEGQSRFDIIYGTVSNGNTSATAGVQQNDTNFQQYFCNGAGGAATGGQSYILSSSCGGGCNGSKIYNIAGFGASGQTNTTRIYDTGTNTWTTGAPLPDSVSDLATAYWNGKIYVAGGFNGAATSALYIYDIASNTWTTGAPMPTAEYLAGFGIINGKLYIASGNNGSTEVNALQIYDIASNAWSTGPNVPTPVTGPGCAVYQGKLYLFGGGAPFPTTTTATQIFNPGTNSWSSGPNMNVNRVWFYGGAVDDTSIVAPGGDQSPGTPINDNEQLTATWAIKAPVPYAARGPFAVSDGTVVYIGGGYDGTNVHADLLRYDPVANTYTPLASSPDGHFLSQAVLVNCAPMASSAFSRRVHGSAGTFDIPLPLTGNVGVECRTGTTYQMIVNFPSTVTVGSASVTSGTGTVSSFSGSGTSQITVNLTGVTDAQRITMTLHNVNDGTHTGDVPIPMGVLVGDVNGNALVNSSDVSLTKAQSGQPVTGSNFREDVNASGTISSTDVAIVKSEVGTALPP